MMNKLLILSFFTFLVILSGCGKEVSIPNHLEKQSSITLAESQKTEQVGMLDRGQSAIVAGTVLEGVTLEVDSKTYKISKYSSQQTFVFINKLPRGARISVKFKGEIKTGEIDVKTIE